MGLAQEGGYWLGLDRREGSGRGRAVGEPSSWNQVAGFPVCASMKRGGKCGVRSWVWDGWDKSGWDERM